MVRFAMPCVLAVALLIASPSGRASFLFETATGNPLRTALVLDDFFWPGHPFEITSVARLQSVGGFFDNAMAGTQTIFAAVVSLSGPFDFPDSLNLSTPDILGTTLLAVPHVAGDYSGNLALTLAPGWYALVFGAGRFGADIGVTDLFMPSLEVDLSPLFPFTAIQVGNPFGTPPQFVYQAVTPRFFAAVPEPATLALIGVGLAGLGFSRRHKPTNRPSA